MDSREIVIKSLEFEGPERIPMTLPPPYPNDIVGVGLGPNPYVSEEWEYRGNSRWERVDEWGNTWARLEAYSKGEVVKGAIEDWSQYDSYKFPPLDMDSRYDPARRIFKETPDKFHIGHLPGFPFSIARYLRRMDNFLLDVAAEKEKVARLLKDIADLLEVVMEKFARSGADAVMFAEDWGTQDRLLVSPKSWRELFKPGFIQLCSKAHKLGLYVFMHSCGHIYEIIPDLIEVGIDVLQFDQPALHGVDNLARDFGGKVNFWCPVDIQQILPKKDERLIEEFAREMIEKLGAFNGGFIAGYYGSNEALGLDPYWQDVACRAFVKYGFMHKNLTKGGLER
ncbi:MAG: hypothetical protein KBI34_05170 [Dictyoglomi bacterium]|nr:hypothetical protein [Dictyoglomota bacterium]